MEQEEDLQKAMKSSLKLESKLRYLGRYEVIYTATYPSCDTKVDKIGRYLDRPPWIPESEDCEAINCSNLSNLSRLGTLPIRDDVKSIVLKRLSSRQDYYYQLHPYTLSPSISPIKDDLGALLLLILLAILRGESQIPVNVTTTRDPGPIIVDHPKVLGRR